MNLSIAKMNLSTPISVCCHAIHQAVITFITKVRKGTYINFFKGAQFVIEVNFNTLQCVSSI